MPQTIDIFENLLDAANAVLSEWLDSGQPHNDAMIALHCAARKADGSWFKIEADSKETSDG